MKSELNILSSLKSEFNYLSSLKSEDNFECISEFIPFHRKCKKLGGCFNNLDPIAL